MLSILINTMKKGQTALEYLLIVVVALIVVIAVWMFLAGSKERTAEAASEGIWEGVLEKTEFVYLLPFFFGSHKIFKKKSWLANFYCPTN